MPGPELNSPTPAEELPLIAPPLPSGSMPPETNDQTIRKSFELKPSLELDLGQAFREEMARK